MSNIFKSTNTNTNTNNNNYRNEWNSRKEKPNNFLNNNNNNNNTANKLYKKVFLFNNESFPDLVSSKKKNMKTETEKNNPLFTKILHEKLEEERKQKEREQEEREKEDKHWIVLKKGLLYQKQEEKEEEEVEVEIEPRKVFEQLTKNYEKWKKNYIESWGYDEYEKQYRFPNHDYRYYETSDSNSDYEDY